MKKLSILLAFLLLLSLGSIVYGAEGDCPYGNCPYAGSQGWNYCPYCGQYLGQGSYGMGPGMMGRGGMMGGYGMGPGMMGGGYGYHMGPGMMGPGYGMGPGMMGPGYYQQNEACQKFLDESAGMRKDLHNKRYEYFEAVRNPKTTPETVAKLEKEIRELQEKVYSKAPQGCWAQ